MVDERMDAALGGADMQLKDRIEVYYTEEEEWYAGVVQGLEAYWDEDEGETRVLAKIRFDSPTEGCWAKGDNPRWHFTDEVRWRKESRPQVKRGRHHASRDLRLERGGPFRRVFVTTNTH